MIARARSCHRQLHPVSAGDSRLQQQMTMMKKMLLHMNQQDLSDCVGHQVKTLAFARLAVGHHSIN